MTSLSQSSKRLVERPRIIPGTATENWNSGVATSGQPGADLITVGTASEWYRLNQFIIVLASFNIASTVTARGYLPIVGVSRLVIEDDWAVATHEVAFLSWWLDAEFYGPFRIEVYSDQAADDGITVIYEYRIKNW